MVNWSPEQGATPGKMHHHTAFISGLPQRLCLSLQCVTGRAQHPQRAALEAVAVALALALAVRRFRSAQWIYSTPPWRLGRCTAN